MKLSTTIAILAGISFAGFAITQITAEESESQYNFAEGTTVSAVFYYPTGHRSDSF